MQSKLCFIESCSKKNKEFAIDKQNLANHILDGCLLQLAALAYNIICPSNSSPGILISAWLHPLLELSDKNTDWSPDEHTPLACQFPNLHDRHEIPENF